MRLSSIPLIGDCTASSLIPTCILGPVQHVSRMKACQVSHEGGGSAHLAKGQALPLCALAPHQALLHRGALALPLGGRAILLLALSLHSKDHSVLLYPINAPKPPCGFSRQSLQLALCACTASFSYSPSEVLTQFEATLTLPHKAMQGALAVSLAHQLTLTCTRAACQQVEHYLRVSASTDLLRFVSSGRVSLRLLSVLFRLLQRGCLQLLGRQRTHLRQRPQLHSRQSLKTRVKHLTL